MRWMRAIGIVEGKGDERITEFCGVITMAACGNDQILATVEGIGHWGRLCGNGKFVFPELSAGRCVKAAQIRVFGCCCNNQACCRHDRTAEVGDTGIKACDSGPKGMLPDFQGCVEFDCRNLTPRRRGAGVMVVIDEEIPLNHVGSFFLRAKFMAKSGQAWWVREAPDGVKWGWRQS
jgi:hypothetical protein